MPISHKHSRGLKAKVTLEKSRKFDGSKQSEEKRARTLVDGKLFYYGNLYQKGKVRNKKMNTLNKQPASFPVFVDVLFWEPHAKTVFIIIAVLITV